MARLNIDDVKSHLTYEYLFTRYNIEIVTPSRGTSGNELTILCPFHDDTKPSLKANKSNKLFNCFANCGAKGDIIDFVRLMEQIDTGNRDKDRVTAARLVQQWLNGINDSADDQPATQSPPHTDPDDTPPEPTEPNPVLTFTLKLDPSHPYLKERGLQDETIAHFGIGYCNRGMMKGRIAIPIHNEHGELVAYAGRYPGDPPEGEPKYLLPPNFHKSSELYNLHRATPHAADGLIVVEGFFTVFEFAQQGRYNVVATMGNALSATQERLIVETVTHKGRVLIAFDEDDAGRRGAQNAANRLITQTFVRTIALPC